MRCGGSWKRDYGTSYPGTKGETLDTDKERPTGYRASSRPYRGGVRKRRGRRTFRSRGEMVASRALVEIFLAA